ncbi:MAG: hypothetical protein OEY75_00280 [Hylemonella sp.]|nr:hypothetical protein [Hylemonella sp.]MDH5707521.1 hypothetical protein [Hylemonella sp.]
MSDLLRYAGQAFLYALFALVIGYFSTSPPYRMLEDDQALLRLSLQHAGQLRFDCRQRSAAELAKLAPNMRTAADCPRERSPVAVRVELDQQALIDEVFAPAGLSRDGAAAGYRRLPIQAGSHTLRVRINDDARRTDFPYEKSVTLDVRPGQVLLIDFRPELGGILIR